MSLLEVKNLKVHFPVKHGMFSRVRETVKAVDDVSFRIAPGETVGLVGESGCGKTTLGRAIIRLVEPTAGDILLDGESVVQMSGSTLRARRRKFQMIFQDPYGSLNPRMTVEQIVGEALDIHKLTDSRPARQKRIAELLKAVGLDPVYAQRYPHEFSGGQRQRIGIARALAVEPKLIICDEPVSALDVSVQAQIINLLKDLQQQHGIAYLFIAHDLAVVEHISHRVLVMYLGKIVESAEARSLIRDPQHPYTQALISAVPEVDPETKRKRIVLPGDVPSPIHPPSGCPFHPRCPIAQLPKCQDEFPEFREVKPGTRAACHFAGTKIDAVGAVSGAGGVA
ncbi:MAG TPA: dipeptide ABC transporter ATP-binding protein [Verrucomicrobiae bacterium]|nr:dipeptide ABC transporter ATP-binding protein [Verrucomicrobiae bacterium]